MINGCERASLKNIWGREEYLENVNFLTMNKHLPSLEYVQCLWKNFSHKGYLYDENSGGTRRGNFFPHRKTGTHLIENNSS